ncbi:hypothetical protein EC973_004051 [Apophysomyces ossiformis]|uniref:Uncharacterized protein n=1 Tax=Apophysomyces ossiformis TaxID=679940 RepID=A0A8H7BQC4_9FUNG|nr:hypothetical protein EC973_004051 [Apophysomyces ossiformis]
MVRLLAVSSNYEYDLEIGSRMKGDLMQYNTRTTNSIKVFENDYYWLFGENKAESLVDSLENLVKYLKYQEADVGAVKNGIAIRYEERKGDQYIKQAKAEK